MLRIPLVLIANL